MENLELEELIAIIVALKGRMDTLESIKQVEDENYIEENLKITKSALEKIEKKLRDWKSLNFFGGNCMGSRQGVLLCY